MATRHGMRSVLALRLHVGTEELEAFSVLQRYSNESNVKLRELAQRVKIVRSLPAPTD